MSMMSVTGLIERRILVNFRVTPEVIAKLLPAPFRPKLIHGEAIGGICLIRLSGIRPGFVPRQLGIGSENVAHRIAVEWEDEKGCHSGVYIPRRDSTSLFNVALGGRLFPGVHHPAQFKVIEDGNYYYVRATSRDRQTNLLVEGRRAEEVPSTSVFSSLAEASQFFQQGSQGYSPDHRGQRLQGLELCSYRWRMKPLAIDRVQSSFFEDESRFPAGSLSFDSAFLMVNIEHEWQRCQSL